MLETITYTCTVYSVHTHPISDAYHLREVWKKVKWNIKKGKLFCVSAHKSRYVYYRIHRFTVHKQYEERSSSFSASIVSLEICGDMYSQFTHKIARWWQWDGWEGDGGWVVEQQATSNNVCNINTWLLDNFTSYIFYVAVANSLSLSHFIRLGIAIVLLTAHANATMYFNLPIRTNFFTCLLSRQFFIQPNLSLSLSHDYSLRL